MLNEWLDRAWVLTWGGIILATLLLVTKMIEPAMWLSVFQLSATGFFGLQLVQRIGASVVEAKSADSTPK